MMSKPSSTTTHLRSGFSVLELVVAMTLGIVLMSAIWTMFSIFTRRQEIDRIQTEKSQLLRGLHQILARDLANIIPQSSGSIARGTGRDPPAGRNRFSPFSWPIPFDSTGLDSFKSGAAEMGSLVGTKLQLQILVFNDGVGDEALGESTAAAKRFLVGRGASVDWPFKTLVYRWDSPRTHLSGGPTQTNARAMPEHEPGKPGFSRRETLFGSQSEASANPESSSRSATGLPGFGFQLGSGGQPQPLGAPVKEQVVSEETVSEFSDFAFEYFDGSDWRDSWDSRETSTLPTAIRVAFNLRFEKTARSATHIDDASLEFPSAESPSPPTADLNRFEHQFILMVSHDSKPTKTSDVSRTSSIAPPD